MKLSVLAVLLVFVIGEEIVASDAQKVVLVVPRQVRRSPASPWRQPHNQHKKSLNGAHEYHHHTYQHVHYRHPNAIPIKKPLVHFPSPAALIAPDKSPYPQGGDDFDEDHDDHEVNHVRIPYGKDVSHAISFGKGYIPYDTIKGSFSPGHEKYQESFDLGHKQPDFAATFTSGSPDSEYLATSAGYHDVSDPFGDFPGHELDFGARKTGRKKFYSSRSIDKDLATKTHRGFSNIISDKDLVKGGEGLFREAEDHGAAASVEGSILLPAGGVPPATIGGSKDGIVLKDSIVLDDYHKTMESLAKVWPTSLLGNVRAVQGQVPQLQQIQAQALQAPQLQLEALQQSMQSLQPIQTHRLSAPQFASPISWFPTGVQGYAVKEDIVEPTQSQQVTTILSKLVPPVAPQSGLPAIQTLQGPVHQFPSGNIQTVAAPVLTSGAHR